MIAYLQEVYAGMEAGNAFVDAEIVIEGDPEDDVIDEDNPRVIAMRVRILVKTEKKKAMNFLTRPKSFYKSIRQTSERSSKRKEQLSKQCCGSDAASADVPNRG